jgi:RNA polymerase sigma factor (sigma-70 family)
MAAAGAHLEEIEGVYRSRGHDFFRLAYATVGDVHAAHDAVQEGFARAVRGRHSYRRSGSLEAWIARCVVNAARDETRRRRPVAEGLEAGELTASEGSSIDDTVVRAAVRRLPKRQRDVLFLRFYVGLDYPAIAEALGVAVGTVSATLHAARAALVQNLQEVPR